MSDNINDMNFKQLRNEVQLLRDELAIFKRKYEDIIYNLDDDNFSTRIVREKGEMRTAIEVNAEGIKTKVSNEDFESEKIQTAEKISQEVKKLTDADTELSSKITQTASEIRSEVKSKTDTLDGKFNNYSTVTQTAEKIEQAVESVNTTTDNKLKSYSTITQTAEAIESRVESLTEADAELTSAITQTSSKIASVVSKNISVKFQRSNKPTYNNTTDEEKGMLCEYNGTLYYYNDITETWKVYPYADGIISQFVQTASGFELTGDVSINGDAIVSGTISANRIDTENLSCTRLYAKGNYSGYSVRLNGNIGDFGIFNGSAGANASANDGTCMFGVYNSFPNVNFFVYGENFLGYDVNNYKTWAKGTWDFSACTVYGVYARFG